MKKITFFLITLFGLLLTPCLLLHTHYLIKNKKFYSHSKTEYSNYTDYLRGETRISTLPDKLDIMLLGGSTSYGMGVAKNSIWSELYNKEDLHKITNFSMLGGNLQEFIESCEKRNIHRNFSQDFYLGRTKSMDSRVGICDYSPKQVWVAPQVNEIAPKALYFLQGQNSPISFNLFRLLENISFFSGGITSYYLSSYIRSSFEDHVSDSFLNSNQFKKFLDQTLKSYESNLTTIVKRFQQKEAKVKFLIYPNLYNGKDSKLKLKKAFKKFNNEKSFKYFSFERELYRLVELNDLKVLKKVGDDLAVPLFELGFDLKSKKMKLRLDYFIDPIHLSSLGHKYIFESFKRINN